MPAVFSECGKHRYRLERQLSETGKVIAFFGINPSTADDENDDATVKKWTGFARKLGARKFIVGNMFSYITPYIDKLSTHNLVAKDENERHLQLIISEADILIPCWGTRDKVPSILHPNFDQLLGKIKKSNKSAYCFGCTKSGDPKHVLRLPYATKLEAIECN